MMGAAAALALGGGAAAQQWPARPVKIIVTFPPGGASDAAARVISGPLGEKLGQSVVIDNKPGGGTTIGANAVLAAKDDHTLMLSNSAPISIAPDASNLPSGPRSSTRNPAAAMPLATSKTWIEMPPAFVMHGKYRNDRCGLRPWSCPTGAKVYRPASEERPAFLHVAEKSS